MVNNGWMAETDDRRLMCFVEKPEALVRMLELAEQEGWI
jgi:hypothetical protein